MREDALQINQYDEIFLQNPLHHWESICVISTTKKYTTANKLPAIINKMLVKRKKYIWDQSERVGV